MPMHVAYRRDEKAEPKQKRPDKKKLADDEAMREISYGFYKRAVRMYAAQIAEIQKTIPGWMPEFK